MLNLFKFYLLYYFILNKSYNSDDPSTLIIQYNDYLI